MRNRTERRRKTRVPLKDSLRITWIDRNDRYYSSKASSLDVSESGLRIEMRERPDAASYLSIHGSNSGNTASARIRHLIERGTRCFVGLEFNPGSSWKALPEPPPPSAD